MNHPDVVCVNKKQLAVLFENLNNNGIYLESVKTYVKQEGFPHPTYIYVAEEPTRTRVNQTLTYKADPRRPVWGKAIFYYSDNAYRFVPPEMKITDAEAASISNLV